MSGNVKSCGDRRLPETVNQTAPVALLVNSERASAATPTDRCLVPASSRFHIDRMRPSPGFSTCTCDYPGGVVAVLRPRIRNAAAIALATASAAPRSMISRYPATKERSTESVNEALAVSSRPEGIGIAAS